jgi:hypothetical protein
LQTRPSLFLSEQKSKGPLLTPLWSQEYEPIYLLNSDVVAIKVNDYSSLQSLLNDLYVHYLKDSYNPYTYGRDWVLGYEIHVDKKLSITRLLVPWNWLLRSDNQPLSHSDPSWAASAPEAYGLKANVGEMGWRIIDGLPGPTFGIATNSPDIASIIRNESRSAKEALTTRFEFGIILSLLAVGDIGPSISLEDPHLVHPGDYKFLFVMNPRARDYPQFERKAIVFKGYLKADSN